MLCCVCVIFSLLTACAGQKPASESNHSASDTGTTMLTVNAHCTVEINGKTGRVEGNNVSGDIPVVDTYMIPTSRAQTAVEIQGEGPISVQIDKKDFYLSIFSSRYSMSVDADKPARIQVSEELATVQVTESTELKYKFIFDDCMISFSGTVDEQLQITRESKGVYLVEGLSGSGTLRCENTETYEILAEQNYEAGENRSFRAAWDGKTITITDAE